MSDIVIKVEGLSKQYHIGGKQERYNTLRVSVTDALVAPFRRAGKLLRGQATGAAELHETIWALKNVSFQVKCGEVIGIIGRNGAGKSTLLKILSEITEPTEGVVRIRGRVGSLLEVGTGFHPELTGRENIYLNGAILGMTRKEIDLKFDEIVSFAEVEKFIDTPVKHYSSGMGLRLGFAVAAHLEPEILVVDEVLAVGDLEFQRKCLGRMNDVAGTGRTVLFVSHNMSAVSHLCSRTILLNKGHVRCIGDTNDVVLEYQKTSLALGEESLIDRKDRKGEGGIRLTQVRFLDVDGKSTTRAVSGRPLLIELEYQTEKDLSQVDFAIGFRTLAGATLFLCNTSHSIGPFSLSKGSGKVYCKIGELPLAAGTYSVNLAIMRGTSLYDWIGNACTLDVETINYFGNGSVSPRGHSPFLVKSYWGLNSGAEVSTFDSSK